VVGIQLNTAGLSYSLLPWFPRLLYSVKYKQEENVEHQETKELSRECNIVGRMKWFQAVMIALVA
jgi:hypothetical protein